MFTAQMKAEAPEIHKSVETSSKARKILPLFFLLWYDLIFLERLNFSKNLLLESLTVKGTSLKWFCKKISDTS